MNRNDSLKKVEEWFLYYSGVYSIFCKNVLMNRDKNLSILLSSFNTVPSEEDNYSIGQMLKLDLLKGKEVVESIFFKTTDEEAFYFQYAWALVVNHFLHENFRDDYIINYEVSKSRGYDRSVRSLESSFKIDDVPIAKANFGITYKKEAYDNFLKQLIFYHNEKKDSSEIFESLKKYLLDYDDSSSMELDSSLKNSAKVYQRLKHKQNLF